MNKPLPKSNTEDHLIENIRLYVYVFSVTLAAVIYLNVVDSFSISLQDSTKVIKPFALTALILVYLFLLVNPLTTVFSKVPFRAVLLKAQQAIGISAFFFGSLHGLITFFISLGGFSGLAYLTSQYIVTICLGAAALFLLTLFAIAAFRFFPIKFEKWRNIFNQLMYVAGLLILIHAIILGTHFANLYSLIPQITLYGLLFLLVLEAVRIDRRIQKRFTNLAHFGLVFTIIIALLTAGVSYYFSVRSQGALTVGLHAQHLAQLQQKQNIANANPNAGARFSVSFSQPPKIEPGKDTELRFKVFNANTGQHITKFEQNWEKLLHLIVVDSKLQYFNHIHPEFNGSEFIITTQFPAEGYYQLYTDFKPFSAGEQTFAFAVSVGNAATPEPATNQPDVNLTKVSGSYEVTLSSNGPLRAQDFASMTRSLIFTVKDSQTKQPIRDLEIYLASFGHMVMINQKTYESLHIHPKMSPIGPDERTGPEVEFIPLATGDFRPIVPGVYRLFVQFQHNGKVFVTDFTINLE